MRALAQKFSSGGAGIRGDGPISTIRQLTWISANGAINLLDSAFSKEAKIYREPVFKSESAEAVLRFVRDPSPTRLGCDLFWASIPWNQISRIVSKPRVIDFGCGTASYGDYWNMLLPHGVGEYVGIDISAHATWGEKKQFPRRFLVGGHSSGAGVEADLYFSQSALEHFEDDLSFFRDLQRRVDTQATPSLQVHVVPGVDQALSTGAHGWRAYSPRTLSRLAQCAPRSASVYLVGLGGVNTMDLYRRNITIPRLRKKLGLRNRPLVSSPSPLSVVLEDNLAKAEPRAQPRCHSCAVVIDNGFNLNFRLRKIAS